MSISGFDNYHFFSRFVSSQNSQLFGSNNSPILVIESTDLLLKGAKINDDEELNFAFILLDGEKKVVAVTKNITNQEFRLYEGSTFDALLKLTQYEDPECYDSSIRILLDHPNFNQKEEFINFILQKDENGMPRVGALNYSSFTRILKFIEENNLSISLITKTPNGQTLFSLWAGCGYYNITNTMLKLDANISDKDISSAFVKALLNGYLTETKILYDVIQLKKIYLSHEEKWFERAFQNDCNFSDEEFLNLDPELKEKIFFIANISINLDLVKKLKSLGMDEKPLVLPGPGIFAPSMDIVTARTTMEVLLRDLKKNECLLSESEFSKLDESKFISKKDQIERILGKLFVEKIAKINNLKHIKVPKKIVVVNRSNGDFTFRLEQNLKPEPKTFHLSVYSERVEDLNRKLSLEEAKEFMIILEKTGFKDFYSRNYFFAKDGIYFIDTEFNTFGPEPQFSWIEKIKYNLDPSDQEEFIAYFEHRKAAYENSKKNREMKTEDPQAFKNPYKNFLDENRPQKDLFTFNLDSL